MSDPLETILLKTMLPLVPFEGWTENTLRQATVISGHRYEEALRVFPQGAIDSVRFFCAEADRQMIVQSGGLSLKELRLPERIHALIMLRLTQQLPHREAVRRAISTLALPQYPPVALSTLYQTVDAIWRTALDRSTDFSFYTKRFTLAGIYTATLTVWLDDTSPDLKDTRAFLQRRLEDVARLGKAKAALKSYAASGMRWFSPAYR